MAKTQCAETARQSLVGKNVKVLDSSKKEFNYLYASEGVRQKLDSSAKFNVVSDTQDDEKHKLQRMLDIQESNGTTRRVLAKHLKVVK